MGLFKKKNKTESRTYDASRSEPAIRASICTGEQIAGFRNRRTGSFEEVMLIRDDKDLKKFKSMYGIEGTVTKFY